MELTRDWTLGIPLPTLVRCPAVTELLRFGPPKDLWGEFDFILVDQALFALEFKSKMVQGVLRQKRVLLGGPS